MFDLDKALAAWRQSLTTQRVVTGDDLEELERHVRDHVADAVRRGEPQEAAFRAAMAQMGTYGSFEDEYGKVYWRKLQRQRRVGHELIWRFTMFRNYLTVALRTLRRHLGYSVVTVLGLALGLAGAVTVLLFVHAELSYEAAHARADRLARVTTTVAADDHTAAYATTVPALGPALVEQLPEVEQAARLLVEATESSEALFAVGDRRFYESRFAWADSTIFELFTFPFLEGDPATALARPFTVVLTESTARTYFGDAPALGQMLRWNDQLDLEVTGVMADMPVRSHLRFDLLASLQTFKGLGADGMIDNWGYRGFYTYVLLDADEPVAAVAAKLDPAVASLHDAGTSSYGLQPVTDIHLYSALEEEIGPTGSIQLVYILLAIAGILLFVGCVNFINLTTARSAQRAREIGVRKVLGAHRRQLVRQFLVESSVLAGAGFVLALLLVALVLPPLTARLGTPPLAGSVPFYLGVGGLALVAGLAAGAYPALYLSAFRPTAVLRGTRPGGRAGWVRAGLVATQFALSMVLLSGTVLVVQQLRYLRSADLGFAQEQVVALPLHNVFGQPQQDIGQLRTAFGRLPGVQTVAATSQLPSRAFVNNWTVRPEGRAEAGGVELTRFDVEPGALETLGLDLVAGRAFDAERATDRGEALIVNEAAVQRFGWGDPIGQPLIDGRSGEVAGTVVGVVRDFHFQSMRQAVGPVVFGLGQPFSFQYLLVRLTGGDLPGTLDAMAEAWTADSPAWPFSYLFLDDEFDAMYRSVEQTAWVVGVFALLAVFVACLGIVGLTAYAVEQRTKELGIRKALGASFADLLLLLQRGHLRLLLVAAVVAMPLAYLAADRWLAAFAYRIDPSVTTFLLAGLAVAVLAVGTVSYQTIRAARTDPARALRYE